jgi:peptide deformylase
MKKLQIVKGEDNPILRAVSTEVKTFNPELKSFAKQMKEAMIKAKGLGIAAPQVGKNIRIFIVTLNYGSENEMMIYMVNPKILSKSTETEVAEEGCLSLPGVYGNVERSIIVSVEFYNLDGARQEMELEGLNARVVQHENDHIDGILFTDKLK